VAAIRNVSHSPAISQIPRHGVLCLFGFGIRVSIVNGHLSCHDGIGNQRRSFQLSKVNSNLKRLVLIGSDGFLTLEALRWVADREASFCMLDRRGKVLAVTGPVSPSDAKLRRAQALAHGNGTALKISRELISQKLAGQEQVARNKLLDSATANAIAQFRAELPTCETIATVRLIESQAAQAYWSAWHSLPINFPRNDLRRVPDHWRSFGARVSPLTGSPRLAVNPPNAILNYLYAVLEAEARLAAAALGLDPGLGVLHVDTKARDSLACDLMEPVRPQADSYLLDWITRQLLKREWFFEQRDGNCRLMSALAVELAQTAPMWGRAVAPLAECVAGTLWSSSTKPGRHDAPPTRLTQRHKREVKGASPLSAPISPPRKENLCRGCGKTIRHGRTNCAGCAIGGATNRLAKAASLGRVAAQSPESRAKHSASRRRHAQACSAWDASSQPAWLTAEFYAEKIRPRLARMSSSAIASRIGVSRWYAGRIREGYRPHPRHWWVLAQLVGMSPNA
jgi:CRISPR-associated endonuclease Cas1